MVYDLKMAGLVVQMKNNINKKAVGIAIKKIRTINKYSLQQFANVVGVSKETILNWENGIEMPNRKQLIKIKKIPINF